MSSNRKPREFVIEQAKRARVPLSVGLFGPPGSGKSYSGLRLATAMAKVYGGPVVAIDTENRRLSHYADYFQFKVINMPAPHGSLDYIDAITAGISGGAGAILIDSGTHEHEGAGGYLDLQAQECERLAKLWNTSIDKAKMSAWQEPVRRRRRLIDFLTQTIQVPVVICFRAKEKLKIVPGKNPEQLGWMPVAGDDLVYELTACGKLEPSAGGIADWTSKERGTDMMLKMPEQFRDLLMSHKGPIDERLGEAMARWAIGSTISTSKPTADSSGHAEQVEPSDRDRLAGCNTLADLAAIWKTIPNSRKTESLVAFKDQRKAELDSATTE